jgi:hypothetical protein
LDCLAKVFTQSDKGEENKKLTLSQQRQRVIAKQGQMSKIQERDDEFSERMVFESQYQYGLRVWDPEQMPKPRNSFKKCKVWRISHKKGDGALV